MRICDCGANYSKECLFPEEYDTVGCTSGEGEGECWYAFLYEKGSNASFLLGQGFTKEEAISLKQRLEEDVSVVVELGRFGH